jgi:hypothetical protein
MISAAEQHVLGCPLPASLVARTESMRSLVAMFISAGMRTDVSTDKKLILRNGNYNARMLALRYVYVLALVIWLGGMIVLGALVAPVTFDVLPGRTPEGRELAGAVFGAVLAAFHYVAYGAGGVLLVTLAIMRILGPRPAAFGIRAAIVAVMLAIALYSGFVILTRIDSIQAAAGGSVSRLPPDDARRTEFDGLHQLSTRLMLFNMAGALVLLYWEAREK